MSPLDLIGGAGSGPVEALPLLRLSQEDAAWIMDTLVMLDSRNRSLVIRLEGRGGDIQFEQIYGDHDLIWFDPFAGGVIVARRNLGGGHVELLEITAAGDTVWSRRLTPPAVSMTPDQVDALVDDMARGLGRNSPTPHEAMRGAVRKALYLPDPLPGVWAARGTASGEVWLAGFEKADTLGASYAVRRNLPAVSGVVATASGEVWLKTPGVADGLVSWYSIPRGESQVSPRLVLLPATLRLQDALGDQCLGLFTGVLSAKVRPRFAPRTAFSLAGQQFRRTWTPPP